MASRRVFMSSANSSQNLADTLTEFVSNSTDMKEVCSSPDKRITTISSKLNYDGVFYRWNGTLEGLKRFVENSLKLYGKWSSPGGEVKLFCAEESKYIIKWYGLRSRKLIIQADDDKQYLKLEFQKLSNSCDVDKSDERCEANENLASPVTSTSFAKENANTSGEDSQVEFFEKATEAKTFDVNKQNHESVSCFADWDIERMNDLEVFSCTCKSNCGRWVTNEQLQDIKFEMSALEAIIRHQDELIRNLNEDNLSFKSKLSSVENLILKVIHDNRNNDHANDNEHVNESISEIVDDFPSRDCEQLINLNTASNEQASSCECALSSPANKQTLTLVNEKVLPSDNEGFSTPSENQKSKTEVISKQKDEFDALKNENQILKLQLERMTSNSIKTRNSVKRSTPCPFLARRGWCAKGNRCDFKHPERIRDADQKHLVPCPFLKKRGFCVKGDRCDFSHSVPYHMSTLRSVNSRLYPPFFSHHQRPMIPTQINPYGIMNKQDPPNNQGPQGYPWRPLSPQPRMTPLMEIPVQPPLHYAVSGRY